MKIDFSQQLKDLDGDVIIDDSKKDKPITLTLGKIAIGALTASYVDEPNLSGEDKLTRYQIAMKIKEGGEVDLTIEEISEVKKLIGKYGAVLIVGQAYQMIEGGKL